MIDISRIALIFRGFPVIYPVGLLLPSFVLTGHQIAYAHFCIYIYLMQLIYFKPTVRQMRYKLRSWN